MRLVFMGTPDFSVPALRGLAASRHEIVEVVTRPDVRTGRGRKLAPPPVKSVADELGIPATQIDDLRSDSLIAHLEALRPDVIVVVAFRILPERILAVPRFGAINLHASLLPKYRGAAPINWAIIRGEDRTGVTVFRLLPTVDTGDVIRQRETAIGSDETFGELYERLSVIGAEEVAEALDEIAAGTARPRSQGDSLATSAPKLVKTDARIDWSSPSESIRNLVRGTTPSPGAHTTWDGSAFGVLRVDHAEEHIRAPDSVPGAIVATDPTRGPAVMTGDGAVWLTAVKPPGKRPMDGASWQRGARPSVGSRFE